MDDKIVYKDLSYQLVGLAIQVRRELGFGFLEKVYENALMVLLRENGIFAQQQMPIKVQFHGQIVGDYIADILVENSIILELKALEKLLPIHDAAGSQLSKSNGHQTCHPVKLRKRLA